MESYPVDLDPAQIVRWLLAEQTAGSLRLQLNARRSTEVREILEQQELHLGDEERDDLSEIATIGTLEITPQHRSEGWRLTIVVEDEAGPRLVEPGPAGEQSIDLSMFYHDFLRPGRGTASIMAEVESPDGETHLMRLLTSIETDSHPDHRSAPDN